MEEQGQPQEKERRDWVIILIIILFGFLCVILAGGWAVRFAPTWSLDTDMGSNIDPNSDFLTNRPDVVYEPVDPSILTQPVWIGNFLTPGASPQPLIPTITTLSTNTPLATTTTIPTTIASPTGTVPTPSPTNIYFPPPTNTPKLPVPPTNTPLPAVDLAITKDDGNPSYIAGGSSTYTVIVTNNGPTDVIGAVLTDNKPTQITTWSWACTSQNGGASGCDPITNSNTNFTDTIDLPNGASIVYTVTANISGSATGNLVNTAAISAAGYTETNAGNNSATDTNTLATASADLSIAKDDGTTVVNNGDPVTYIVRVTNNGPDSVTGAILSDPAATGLNKTGVVCSGTPGQCVTPPTIAQLQSGNFALPTLNNGQFYEISISASVTATSGSISNTATISVPASVNDANTSNNSATDTDLLPTNSDLQITKTDGVTVYQANDNLVYTITVTNNGPDNVSGVTITDLDLENSNFAGSIWFCVGTGGATCTVGGLGNINDTASLPNGSSVTYTVFALVASNPSGSLVNTASVSATSNTDPNLSNNSATDTNALAIDISNTNLETGPAPTGSPYQGLVDGEILTLALSTPVVVGGDASYDLIYYEELTVSGTDIAMDWVILQIGDGTNWYTILNWGDGNTDTNTNIAIPLAGNSGGNCNGEPDNCSIDSSLLVNNTGVTIDVDSLGIPAGSYSYLRITAPAGGSGDGVAIDGIYVVP